MKPLFAIMVTYRRHDEFRRTLDSLLPTLPEGSTLLIVDNENYSYDDPNREWLYNLGTAPGAVDIRVWLPGANNGWGWAMNHGLEKWPEWRNYEYVLETNNDVTYEPDWFQRSKALMEKYPTVGLLALWRHVHHGTLMDLGDILIRDNAPAVSWLFRSKDLQRFLPFPEHGSTKTSGGNGEDVAFTHKVMETKFQVASPREDLSHHMDGYNLPNLGKDNPAYG